MNDFYVGHIGIVVNDIAKSMAFWKDCIGLEKVDEFDVSGEFLNTIQQMENVKIHVVKLQDKNGLIIELLKYIPEIVPENPNVPLCVLGIRHIAINCDDAEKVYDMLCEQGFIPLSKPGFSKELNIKVFFVRDPEGNLVEFFQG